MLPVLVLPLRPLFVRVGGPLHHRAEMPLGMPASTHGKLAVQSAPDPVDHDILNDSDGSSRFWCFRNHAASSLIAAL
jgi:hypothetical protein